MERWWPLLAVAVAGLIAGGIKSWQAGLDSLASALIAAGLIFLGAWMVVEVDSMLHRHHIHHMKKKDEDSNGGA